MISLGGGGGVDVSYPIIIIYLPWTHFAVMENHIDPAITKIFLYKHIGSQTTYYLSAHDYKHIFLFSEHVSLPAGLAIRKWLCPWFQLFNFATFVVECQKFMKFLKEENYALNHIGFIVL